jgi:hypothetical protein
VNVLKPHLQTTIWTLLDAGASQRQIERVTGIDRKTIRAYQKRFAAAAANSPGVATDSGQIPPPRPPTAMTAIAAEPDLLVLDDLFLARRISDASAELLQTIVHQRYKRRASIVVTSNRIVRDWGKYLGDATMGTTILDRLMHRSVMLEFEGKSYRLKEAAARIALEAEA